MNVVATVREAELIVHISGELDALSVKELRPVIDNLLQSNPPSITVDLTELELIDSSGVGLLVYLFRHLRATNRTFGVRGARQQPLAILRLMKLDGIFTERSSAAAAAATIH